MGGCLGGGCGDVGGDDVDVDWGLTVTIALAERAVLSAVVSEAMTASVRAAMTMAMP